jgi:lipopolysaccharide export system ATP-binding protein
MLRVVKRKPPFLKVVLFKEKYEIVGLLGPNGAGKTTCFYIACGLVKTDSGQVILNNHKIDHLPMHKRAKLGL